MEKNKYYVNIGTQEISVNLDGNNDEFVVYATEEEILSLRETFDEMYNADVRSFYRAHVPIMPYHYDDSNDEFDDGMVHAFKKIHDLGDEKTKAHIESMGILENK